MSGLAPLHHESAPLRRKITASLRGAIEAGTLRPGERLVEKDLCLQLSVSRTSLREAIRELESEGLLVTGPGGGVAVAGITADEATNIYSVRAALEALAAEQCALRASDDALLAIREAATELARRYQAGRIDEMLSAKRLFYERLCAGAGNAVLLDFLNRLNSRINRLRATSLGVPNRLEQSIGEIWAIVEALERRDPGAARTAALHHIQQAAAAALK